MMLAAKLIFRSGICTAAASYRCVFLKTEAEGCPRRTSAEAGPGRGGQAAMAPLHHVKAKDTTSQERNPRAKKLKLGRQRRARLWGTKTAMGDFVVS